MTSTPRDPALPPVGCIVVAAGKGTRLGAALPKAFVSLAGRSILDHALRGVLAVPEVGRVVAVVPAQFCPQVTEQWCDEARVRVVAGGAERTDSVGAGLAALTADWPTRDPRWDLASARDPLAEAPAVVLVHDAARCLTPADVFERVVRAIDAGAAAAVPGLPVVDTIKVVGEDGHVVSTPQRSTLRAVQTPQGFTVEALQRAHASGGAATDDAALVEALGLPVVVVDGDACALKVTTPEDLHRAEALLRALG